MVCPGCLWSYYFFFTGVREFQCKACHPQTDLIEGPGLSELVLVYAGIRLAKAILSVPRTSAHWTSVMVAHSQGMRLTDSE